MSEMQNIRCECGHFLGRFKGRFDIKCPKCKRITRGETEEDKQKSLGRLNLGRLLFR